MKGGRNLGKSIIISFIGITNCRIKLMCFYERGKRALLFHKCNKLGPPS